MNPRRYFPKKLTRKAKAVVPNLMQALDDARARTVEEAEAGLRGEGAKP